MSEQLFLLIENEDEKTIRRILPKQENIDLDAKELKGVGAESITDSDASLQFTALHKSAICGNLSIVGMLLNKGANVKLRDTKGRTALHLAAERGHWLIVKALIEAGAKANVVDSEGRTAIMASKNFETTNILLDAGANLHNRDAFGWTALHHASFAGNASAIKAMIRAGIFVEAIDQMGKTSVFAAIHGRSCSALKVLIDAGASVNVVDPNGWTPLFHAVSKNLPDFTKLLVEAGADMERVDENGCTTLIKVLKQFSKQKLGLVEAKRLREVVETLVSRNANVNALDEDGNSALMYVCQHVVLFNSLGVFILDQGAKTNFRNFFGLNALDLATTSFTNDTTMDDSIKQDGMDLLTKLSLEVSSLQELCRFSIITSIRNPRITKQAAIMSLELPKKLKNYITSPILKCDG